MQVNTNSINAQFDWLSNSSSNVANINTDGYKAIDTVLSNQGKDIIANSSRSKQGVSLVKELSDQNLISIGVEANVKAINTQNKILGTLLDMLV
ncbi:MAG: flagellar biosynthesis protein FlgE [Sulfurospirillum sp.]